MALWNDTSATWDDDTEVWGAMRWLTTTIGAYTYQTIGLRVTERSGGEASPFEFRIPLSVLDSQPISRGDAVAIEFCLDGQLREWAGTVEELISQGAEVSVSGLMLDAYLSRKLVTGDADYADVGAILASFVDEFGAPLNSTHMDTSLDVRTALTGDYKTLAEHIVEWAGLLGLMLWVDDDGAVHLKHPADLGNPTYLLYEDSP